MRITINATDVEYLASILNRFHDEENGVEIKECPEDNCWYKIMIKKLKCPHYLKATSSKQETSKNE